MTAAPLWQRVAGSEVVDLAHALRRGIPASPNHPPFQFALQRRHGDMVRDDGGSAANEIIVTGGHVGTHVDALAHISQDGRLHGGLDAAEVTGNDGFTRLGIDEFPPFAGRGVLLDVAGVRGVDVLPAGEEVTPADLAAAEEAAGTAVGEGDAVLLRTGWSEHIAAPERFRGDRDGTPGPGEAAGSWLAARGVSVVGGETISFEAIQPWTGVRALPVHRQLLVDAGINIIEVMDLRGLAGRGLGAFTFLLAPLKIAGGTGAPARPLALIEPS
ncbi:cyclase family protein [Egibacter rhizosphaerae]|uniref:Cyclase family protein n=1 Tax=Egibacter rhizosphaerae TaxID=1670831 RepID=A0A411YGX5_9ACTN|nr:cyclase family protein [Egibacter rhizosphaerae]QBI20488.1 cyclase family protein [Egibacter rhizosphaerae]